MADVVNFSLSFCLLIELKSQVEAIKTLVCMIDSIRVHHMFSVKSGFTAHVNWG